MVMVTFHPTIRSTGNITSIDTRWLFRKLRLQIGWRGAVPAIAANRRLSASAGWSGKRSVGSRPSLVSRWLGSEGPVGCSSLPFLQNNLIRLPKLLETAPQSRRPSDPTAVALHPLHDGAAECRTRLAQTRPFRPPERRQPCLSNSLPGRSFIGERGISAQRFRASL